MKNKGFTLVELLAVIAILAILVIIALPAVLKMYNKARIDSFSNEVNTIIRTARQQYLLDGGNTTTYTSGSNPLNLTGNKKLEYCLSINSEGKVIELQATNGSYKYEGNGIIDRVNSSEVSETPSGYSLSCAGSVIRFVNRQNEDTITYGDEVSIGSEHFSIISTDPTYTTLLAKYNLLVGEDIEYYFTDHDCERSIKTYTSNDAGYGLQNPEATGEIGDYIRKAVVAFSGTNYWDNSECISNSNGINTCTGNDGLKAKYAINGANYEGNPYPYIYDKEISNTLPTPRYNSDYVDIENNGYNIAYYVEEYVRRLKNDIGAPSSITGRLLSYEEAYQLMNTNATYQINDMSLCKSNGALLLENQYNMTEDDATNMANTLCSGDEVYGASFGKHLASGKIDSSLYNFLGITNVAGVTYWGTGSYYLGSAYSTNGIYHFSTDDYYISESYPQYIFRYGVRPVITIPTSELSN